MPHQEGETQFIKNPEKATEDALRQKILDSLEQTDPRERVDEEIIKKLLLLERNSKFNEDSRKIARGMDNVFSFLEKHHAPRYPQLVFSEKQKSEGRQAAILHDVGKSGPANATKEESETTVRLFAQEQIRDPNLSVQEAVDGSFSENERSKIFDCLKSLDISPSMTIRQLWDCHAQWTRDILEKYPSGLSERVRIIAGSHHIDRGINPYFLTESEIPLQSNIIGTIEEYVDAIEERVLMAVAQYEALSRRKKSTHEIAITLVRQNLAKFKQKDLTRLICDVIDELGREKTLFL